MDQRFGLFIGMALLHDLNETLADRQCQQVLLEASPCQISLSEELQLVFPGGTWPDQLDV
jgi:hypothetical protein